MRDIRFFPTAAALLAALAGFLWTSTGYAEAGEGLRAGDLKLNPRVKLSGAFDQNIFRCDPDETACDQSSAPALRIAPGLKISTLDATSVKLSFDGELQWENYFSSSNAIRAQSGLSGNALLDMTLNPNGGFSLRLKEDLTYRNEPPPFAVNQSWDRLVNGVGASVIIHPGDEILNTSLGYEYELYRYFTQRLQGLDKDSHNFNLEFQWKFLPKTSFVIDGRAKLIRYQTSSRGFGTGDLPNVDSNPIRGRAGLSGLITPRISTRLLGGWAVGLYEDGPTYSGPVGRADITFKYGNRNLDNKIVLGYERDFGDSTVGNYFGYHRGILKLRQNFLQKRFGISIGAEYTRRDYADLQSDAGRTDNVIELPNGDELFINELEDNAVDVTAGLHGKFQKWWRASLKYTFDANFSPNQGDIPAAGNARFLRYYQRHLVLLTTTFQY